MKKIALIHILLVFCTLVSVAGNGNLSVPFQFSLIPPVGTNGLKMAQYTNAVSVNMFLGISKNEKYFTASTLGNISSGYASGLQISGMFNRTGSGSKGLMAGGLFNATKGEFTGLQIAGLVNVAGKVRGVQLSALVNVADESDFPIGLVNIIGNGERGIALTYDILGNAVVSFRSGGRFTYGILGAGFNRKYGNILVTEAGYGIHIPVCGFFRIDNEFRFTAMDASTDSPDLNIGYSLLPSFTIGRHYNIFAGTSLCCLFSWSGNGDMSHSGLDIRTWDRGSSLRRLYLGYSAGIQYIF